MSRVLIRFTVMLLAIPLARVAWAQSLPIDPTNFPDPRSLVSDSLSHAIIETVGLGFDQRPYEPATPLGTKPGLDLGLEITLVKLPPDFATELEAAGIKAGDIPPSIPVPRLQLHKGIGSFIDLGIAYVGYRQYSNYAGDAKIVVYQPEEGLTWAIRGCYSVTSLSIVKTTTITPQVLASRDLEFADPYIGMGYQFVSGSIDFTSPPVTVFGVPIPPQHLQKDAYASAFMAFLGLQMHIPNVGLQLTLEGSYNSAGADTLGTKLGFVF